MSQGNPERRARRDELEAALVRALPELERAVRVVARQACLRPGDAEELAAEVKLTLVENDYAALASFEGRSSLLTYLVAIANRALLDQRRRQWGKWRPSAEARRRGGVAIRLEQLLSRDGLTVEEALETLRTTYRVEQGRDELLELIAALPPRTSRKPVDAPDLDATPAGESTKPDVQLEDGVTVTRVQRVVDALVEALPPQDRLILRLRFEDQVAVADIARLLRIDPKKLYRRLEKLFASFRDAFERHDLGWPEVNRMIDRGHCHLRLPPAAAENGGRRPSQERAEA